MDDVQLQSQFSDLYRHNYGRVLRFVGRRCAVGATAEDLTAEVFRIAWATSLRQGGTVAVPWLFGVARNVVRNDVRADQRQQELQRSLAQGVTSAELRDADVPVVHHALSKLRESDREILIMKYWDELNTAEMSAALEISHAAVWVRLHRARQAVRGLMDATGDTHVTI